VYAAANKGLICLLVTLQGAGCATRKLDFTSTPRGATVQVGDRQAVTPCTLKVPEGVTHAVFSLPTGEVLELAVPDTESGLEDAADSTRSATSSTLQTIGAVTIGVGAVFLALWAGTADGDRPDSSSDGDLDGVAVLGAGALVAGGVLIGMGYWMEPEQDNPVLHADFKWDPEQLYENRDYGAKRIKDVSKPLGSQ
jgi:hypothetical protein